MLFNYNPPPIFHLLTMISLLLEQSHAYINNTLQFPIHRVDLCSCVLLNRLTTYTAKLVKSQFLEKIHKLCFESLSLTDTVDPFVEWGAFF